MKNYLFLIFIIALASCKGQTNNNYKLVGGPCESCEAVLEFGDRELTAIDTLPDFQNDGTKLKVEGTVYKHDGSTPAEDVILYVYHTNNEGIYPTRGNEKGWAKRQGYIRGWVKTDENGKYEFYTLRPGIYPNRNSPAHIHVTVLEPNGKYYWLESYLFDDDPILSDESRNKKNPRGGNNGVMKLTKENGLFIGKRDIILGKNINNYE